MAAKPPKPPGTSLNNNSQQDTVTENANKLFNNSNDNSGNNNNNYIASYSSSEPDSVHLLNNIETSTGTTPTATKHSCNCSNISIMHLFHEMKQEFPTIPDQIVTQCVNENCHDRDNCMLMLRNELALNPIPVQAYPSKVLQRQQQQQKLLQLQQQEQQQQQLQQKPATLLKPTRVAPSPVSVSACVASLNSNNVQTVANATQKQQNNKPSRGNLKNCDSVSVESNLQTNKVIKKDVEIAANTKNTSDMSTTKSITAATTKTTTHCLSEENSCQQVDAAQQQPPPQRVRPTTLNLNPSQQQQQQQELRHQLNVQLQQHLQQRQHPTRPLRKAPLPPLPPKPNTNNNNSNTLAALAAQRAAQHSSNTSLSSPISSGESEISVNVGSLSSPTATGTSPSTQQHQQQQQQQHHQLKSPVRHRSVINVQPEPPYTRDFLVSPTSSSNSQKSFTSVNLTLRQPNSSAPPSTIDISAGPGLSSAGGTGLTYSSTSYDARRGCQKNFHITVTDEGGVFSASRIKPRSSYNPAGEQEHNLPGSGVDVVDVDVNLMRSPTLEQYNQQYPYSYYQPHQQNQQQQQQRVATTLSDYGDMCLPRENDGFKEILHRQRARREKLTTALRDNRKRLSQVEQEINFLTEPISPGESERLDSEIQKLRCDCEAMLNEVENSKRSAPSLAAIQGFDVINRRQQQQLLHQTHPPQPFPRQRPPRPPPPSVGRQPMDFVQHHVVSSTPPSTMHSPNQQLPPLPPTYQQLQQQYQQQLLQQQQILQQQQHQRQHQQQHPHQPSTDDEDYSDSNTDGGDEEDDEGLAMWACSLCTFRNHPQLNICECCENVRILPGRIRIVPSAVANAANGSQSSTATPLLLTQFSASSATHATATPTLTRAEIAAAAAAAAAVNSPTATAAGIGANSLDSDANLTQQQFALHT